MHLVWHFPCWLPSSLAQVGSSEVWACCAVEKLCVLLLHEGPNARVCCSKATTLRRLLGALPDTVIAITRASVSACAPHPSPCPHLASLVFTSVSLSVVAAIAAAAIAAATAAVGVCCRWSGWWQLLRGHIQCAAGLQHQPGLSAVSSSRVPGVSDNYKL